MAETIYDGPPSVGELERSLVEVAAQRDQLDQQVRELLEAADHALALLGPGDCSVNACEGCKVEMAEARSELLTAADKVRKERGE